MKTILSIEDNVDNLKVLRLMIGRLRPDDRFVPAGTAEEGLELVKQLQPDLILMDIDLPGMNGFEAFTILQNHHHYCHIPVIAISAHAMTHDVLLGEQAGFNAYITKPVDMKKLSETLDHFLNHPRLIHAC